MKITFVCPPLNMSGGIRVVAIYARYLKAFGHDVLVISPPHAARNLLGRLMKRLHLPQPAAKRQPPSHLDGSGVTQKILPTRRAVKEADVPDADVIIATWWETAEYIAPMSEAKGHKVYFVQHHEVFDWLPKERVVATYRSSLKKIVVAQWLVKAIADDGNRQGCTLVPNAVDTDRFRSPPRAKNARPRIGTLFSETPFKGFDVALAVLDRVREQMPDVEVVAFGSHAAVEYAGRMGGIDLIVEPAQDRLRDIYASCDVWLTCSKSEGFNLMAMEAMACRTPVVSTRTGWPVEGIGAGVNGYLADVDDVPALAEATLAVLRMTNEAWKRMSDAALDTVKDSSWEASARMFEAALIRNQTIVSG